MSTPGIGRRISQWLKGKRTGQVPPLRNPSTPSVHELTHAQRADIIHAAMVSAGRDAARRIGPAGYSSLLPIAGREGCDGLTPGAAVRQGSFLASDQADGQGSDLE